MKVYVSIDFEGLPGIASLSMLTPKSSQYSRGVKIVTRIARTIAEELSKAGVDRIVIADSHGFMTNIDYLEMPKKTTLIQGFPRPYSMVTGLDESFDAILMIGYHAAAGTTNAILDHTYSGRTFYRIKINGVVVSEYLLNALVAGEYNVPVALVAGDEYLGEQVRTYTPWSVFIPLKKGVSRYAALYDSLDEVLEALKRGLHDAVERIKRRELKPLKLGSTLKTVIEFRNNIYTDIASIIPGVKRIDAYTIEYTTDSPRELLGLIEVLALMAIGIDSLRNYM